MALANITVPNIHDLFANSITVNEMIINSPNAGNFTPTVSNATNCSIIPFPRIRYFRIGSTVYGFFYFLINVPIGVGATYGFDCDLPITRPSNFTDNFDCTGSCNFQTGAIGNVPNSGAVGVLAGSKLIAFGGSNQNPTVMGGNTGHFSGSFCYELV